MEIVIYIVVVVLLSYLFLKRFDKVSGRGPKQVKDGINSSKMFEKDRVPCPKCAEMIKSEAKICRFCWAKIKK